MVRTILKTSLMAHIMACLWIWIIIHYQGEPDMPYEEQEKLLQYQYNQEELKTVLFGLYANKLYFIITTVTTIGYGDNKPFSKLGRLYTMLVQFVGIVIFTDY